MRSPFLFGSEGNKTLTPAQLDLWVGVQKYYLGDADSRIKSETVLEWLGDELKHWLGMEITRENI